MLTLLLLLLIITCIYSQEPSLLDPRVYNFYYYVQHNPELTSSKMYTEQQAAQHWQNIGIVEGLQASGSFHVKQYIDNYQQIINIQCPSPQQNYSCVIYYYLKTGFYDNQIGYKVGGAFGKYTISSFVTAQPRPSLGLFASLSDRMGLSIDSIIYKNFEYINAWDHGRNLQIEITTKYGECYQPNESGSIEDAQSNHTSTKILNINATKTNIYTQSYASYYMAQDSCNNFDGCGCAKNTKNVSNYKISKNIYIKYGYQNSFWINYLTTIDIPEDLEMIIVKAPIISLNSELNTFWKMTNTMNGEIYRLNIDNNGGSVKVMGDGMGPDLLISSTNDTQHAISIVPIIPQSCNGGIWIKNDLGMSQYSVNATSQQYLEYIYYNVSAGSTITANSVISVGTLQDVQFATGFCNN